MSKMLVPKGFKVNFLRKPFVLGTQNCKYDSKIKNVKIKIFRALEPS